ncbi:extracellular tyrosine-protein kinase PKDCC-like [Pollicipes pollicipes]|uniref:extracellular tyrosine-protein kinase PKDCC-like n=1 Tax=Pollicipes pollicipes TaxID=41117 RepID=UPI00188553E3|nr:extracellular tyrosine-protein kinase PKDCC-like [Pollicipes pollicipes]XP_037082659.1 extracellular tyrosine-protein kinase PKDCC-like [Pollicipes pollicipes]XP_037082667.1 extracellular tyrosine-protein kinase PKDCC-like [Pollicipes pollicipes]
MACTPARSCRLQVARCVHVVRASHLTAFVVAYVLVFLVANVVVLKAYWEQRQRELEEQRQWRQLSGQPARRPLGGADAFLQRLQNSVSGGRQRAVFTCADFPTLEVGRRLGFGWSKEVFAATYGGRTAAVKTVNVEGRDMRECRLTGANYTDCYGRTAEKMYREVRLLHQLRHPNIIQLYGFCMSLGRGESSVVAMVTELGEPLHQLALLQRSWEQRLRLALDAADLLQYLATSPLGPAGLADLRLEQFLAADGRLKLADLDDLQLEEPRCRSAEQCLLPSPAAAAAPLVRCTAGRCQGYNARRNQALAAPRLLAPLLEQGAPAPLNASVAALVAGYAAADRSAAEMRSRAHRLLELFQRHGYGVTDSGSAEYEPVYNATLPGHNYRCSLSSELGRCSLSVSGQREASALCSADRRCEGYVLTNRTTWTGRLMTHFKTRIVTGEVRPELNSTLYIRQTAR